MARNGGTENAFTSYDYTAYFQNVAADRLELVMELEAERMTGLVMSDEDVETERQVILEERRMRTDNNPSAILAEQVRATQYYIHPYGWPVIGWNHEIEGLTHQDVVDFYRAHYAPNNAILVIAGDVTLEEVRPLAERIYGAIPAVELAPRERAADPPQSAARRVVMEDPRAAQPSIQLSYMAPTHVTGPSEQAYALEALAQVLSGSTTSRLYSDLVVDQGVAECRCLAFRRRHRRCLVRFRRGRSFAFRFLDRASRWPHRRGGRGRPARRHCRPARRGHHGGRA